ncbi:alkaline phosphatase family protein [Streptomyces sp. NPDC006632]|uniref:phospholipase C n=1 Tax=Streptomyces sp. NPDC006632 TaxID=3157182 RepID=UPI0033B3BD18
MGSKGSAVGSGRRTGRWGALAGAAALGLLSGTGPALADPADHPGSHTATPVKHLVVIFQENVSFDHYFGTYPVAANTDGTRFTADRHTPKDIDTLRNAGLLEKNPNQYPPKRLTPEQALTCDQNHSYGPEQYAANAGRADQYVQNTDSGKCSGNLFGEPGLVMDYYDGNTVTAMWNYAQHYTLGDNSFSTTYGPSTPGAINLVSAQTHGVISTDPASGTEHPEQTTTPDPYAVTSPDARGVGTLTNDPDPAYDDCSDKDHTSKDALAALRGRNIGDLLNRRKVSWGWFQGGFRPSTPWSGERDDHAKCSGRTHTNVGGAAMVDYSPHHAPFQYYESTSNPHHLPPEDTAEIGHDGRANHNYDLTDFDAALAAGSLPSVSFLKAAQFQDGHASYSDPIDEQHFLVEQINKIQQSRQWKDTAVLIAYDDSDGWYDHAYARPQNGSKDTKPGSSGKPADSPACRAAPAAAGGYSDRCGPGTRQPLLVISPYSRVNAVDHTLTEQASITRFIEDNWGTGRLGDASFDARANSLTSAFDFKHPNGKQVLLNTDGSVRSVRDIPTYPAPPAAGPGAAATTGAGNATAPRTADERLAESGASSVLRPAGIVAAALAAGGVGAALAVRRRRNRGPAAR